MLLEILKKVLCLMLFLIVNMFKSSEYILAGPLDPMNCDSIPYWSVTEGWVDKENATRFSFEETKIFEKPKNSLGWISCREIKYKDSFD